MNRRHIVFLLPVSAPLWAQTKKSIYIVTDAEGVAGVWNADNLTPLLSGISDPCASGQIEIVLD